MGKALITLISQEPDCRLAGAIERPDHPDCGQDAAETAGGKKCGLLIEASLDRVTESPDVIIDFSAPEATLNNLDWARQKGAKVVIGTTGFDPAQKKKIREASKRTGIVCSGNMSVGVNLLLNLVNRAASTLKDNYDVEIIEAHHHFKKDAPSGTAKMLAESAAQGLNRKLSQVATYGREGLIGERDPKEIGIHSVRAGDIIGEHTVVFGGPGERVELVHKAQSREIFARGALRAARFISSRKTGLFDMQDVLGLK